MSVFFWRLASLSVTVFAVPSYDTLSIFTPLLKTILWPRFAPEVRLKKPPLSTVPGSRASLKSRMIEVIAFLACATATTPVTCGVGARLPIGVVGSRLPIAAPSAESSENQRLPSGPTVRPPPELVPFGSGNSVMSPAGVT